MKGLSTCSSEYLSEGEENDPELSLSPGLLSEDFLFHSHFFFSISIFNQTRPQPQPHLSQSIIHFPKIVKKPRSWIQTDILKLWTRNRIFKKYELLQSLLSIQLTHYSTKWIQDFTPSQHLRKWNQTNVPIRIFLRIEASLSMNNKHEKQKQKA